MADLINVASGKPETVPDDQVYQNLAAGTHTPTGGYRPLISPEGRLVFSPPTDLQENVGKYGYRLPTQGDLDAFSHQQQYGEGTANELEAFGAGVARGATFGASDYLLPRSGITTKEALSARKELNPAASLTGEVAGAVGSAIAAPEFSAAGRVARGAELAGEVGTAVLGRGAAALTTEGSLASKVLGGAAQVGGKALGSSLEGAVYGAGQSVSEAALGDPDVNAEKIIANIGYGALWGGALGGTLKGLEVAVPPSVGKARDAVGSAYEKLFGGVKEAQGPLEEGAVAQKVYEPGLLTSQIIKAKSAISGTPEDEILQGIQDKLNTPTISKSEWNKLARDFRSSTQSIVDSVSKAAGDTYSTVKPQETAELLTGANTVMAHTEVASTRQILRSAIEEMRAEPDFYPARFPRTLEKIEETFADRTHEPPSPQTMVHVDPETGSAAETVVHNANPERVLPHMSAAEAFEEINRTKQAIDSGIDWNKEYTGDAAKAVSLIKGVRGTIKNSLEKEDVWGEAAARQAGLNDANSQWQQAKKVFMREFGKKGRVDPTKVNSYFNMINDPRADLKHQALKDVMEKSRGLIDQIDKTHQNAGFETFDKQGFLDLLDSSEAQAMRAKSHVQDVAGAHGAGQGKMTDMLLGTAGAMFGGPLGGAGAVAAKGLFNAVHNPQGAIEKLIAFERTAQKTADMIHVGAKAVLGLGKVVTKGLPGTGMIGEKAETMMKTHDRRSADIREFQTQPEKSINKLELATRSGFHAAPNLMSAVQQTAIRGQQFLASKLPKPATEPLYFDAKYTPSPAEVAVFNRYHQVVDDPLSVLQQLKTGTLTNEAIETIKTVYPKLYTEMQQALLEHAGSLKDRTVVPYPTRLALSRFIGQPMDSGMTPQAMQLNQTAMVTPNKPQGGGVKPTAGALQHLGVAGRTETTFQQAASRNM